MAFDQMARALASVLLASTARIAAAVRAKEDDGRSAPVTVGNARKGETAAEVTVSGAFATGTVADAREAHMMGTADASTPVVMRRIRTVRAPTKLVNGRTGRTGRTGSGLTGTRVTRTTAAPGTPGTVGTPGTAGAPGSSTVQGNPAAVSRPGTAAGQERLVKAAVNAAIPRIRRDVATAARDALIAAVRSRRG